ncbi:hypothetical protein ACQP3F_30850, partial [Escherichia coli]
SVTVRLFLVLGPDGLAVLEGHFFIVTPVIKETFDTLPLWHLLLCVHMCGGQRATSGVFFFIETGYLLELGAH